MPDDPLSKQEQFLYQHHLDNLARGGVVNPDGSISTVRQMTVDVGGKTYNIPTVWDNKILSNADALKRARDVGIDKFPSYDNEQQAQSRYDQMHGRMEQDIPQPARSAPQPINPMVQQLMRQGVISQPAAQLFGLIGR